jgi:hypothetical protein
MTVSKTDLRSARFNVVRILAAKSRDFSPSFALSGEESYVPEQFPLAVDSKTRLSKDIIVDTSLPDSHRKISRVNLPDFSNFTITTCLEGLSALRIERIGIHRSFYESRQRGRSRELTFRELCKGMTIMKPPWTVSSTRSQLCPQNMPLVRLSTIRQVSILEQKILFSDGIKRSPG